jgi:hypothetical protein
MGRMLHFGRQEGRIQGFGGEVRGKENHLEALGVGGRIILKFLFKRWNLGMDSIGLVQVRDRWGALVNVVMNLWVS